MPLEKAAANTTSGGEVSSSPQIAFKNLVQVP
jgi:hypothetical protein